MSRKELLQNDTAAGLTPRFPVMTVGPVLVTVELPRTAKPSAVPRRPASIKRSSRRIYASDRVNCLATRVRRVRLREPGFANRSVKFRTNIVHLGVT